MRPLVLLIVDDNEINRHVVAQYIKRFGGETREASNGPEALAMVQAQAVDGVIMDINMPSMNGVQAVQRIRSVERIYGGHLIVIGISGFVHDDDRAMALRAGMDEYITKPIDRKVLLSTLERLFPGRVTVGWRTFTAHAQSP